MSDGADGDGRRVRWTWLRALIAAYAALLVANEVCRFLLDWSGDRMATILGVCMLADVAMLVLGVLGIADTSQPGASRLPTEALVLPAAFLALFWHFLGAVFLGPWTT